MADHGVRKTRKGTQSCWQCKNRKIRCNFVTARDGICDNCKRRGTLCVSQEYSDNPAITSEYPDRISRVEARVEQLVQSINASGVLNKRLARFRAQQDPDSNRLQTLLMENTNTTSSSCLRSLFVSSTHTNEDHDTIDDSLRAAWPSHKDLEVLLAAPVSITWCLRGLIRKPYCTSLDDEAPSARELLQLPPARPHPVLVTQKLLVLGLYVQAIPHIVVRDLANTGIDCQIIMTRAINTAQRLVTSNDDLIASVEGIECLALETIYHDNAGDLRRAWLSNRRAISIAQVLGFHRQSAGNFELQEASAVSNYVWFRLVTADRYLSLMLGLPQGPTDNSFAIQEALSACSPIERHQRVDCVAAGRILQRNEADMDDYAATLEIDRLFQEAASYPELQWWLVPEPLPSTSSDTERLKFTNRLVDQLAHFHLLARLHLPYLLRPSTERKYDYSKITALAASREVLSRYLAFHGSSANGAYCRGIYYLVFIACTTLCLAHINARNHRTAPDDDTAFLLGSLVHQRYIDLGAMKQCLQTLEQIAEDETNSLAADISSILRQLLLLEANSFDGSLYRISSLMRDAPETNGCGSALENGHGLQVNIPSFGKIKIEHEEPSIPALSAIPEADMFDGFPKHATISNSEAIQVSVLNATSCEYDHSISYGNSNELSESRLQGVDVAFFDSLIRGSELDII